MDASTLEVCEREHLIEEHIPRPQSVLRMDLSHYWISRVVALGAGFTCALLLAQALGPKVARGKTEGGGGQFLQEWKFEEVNVNSGDKVFDVLFNQTLYDCIEPVKHIADKRGRCYDTIFARQHKCYALRKEEPPASCKRTVKCLQGKKDEKPINPCEWLCTGGNRNQAWVKERCDKAAHDAMRWSGKCLDHGYEQRSFEAMEDVNVLSQRCVDETTSTTTQVGSHFFCWAKAKKKSKAKGGEDSPAADDAATKADEPVPLKKQKKAKASDEELDAKKVEVNRRKEQSKAAIEANKKKQTQTQTPKSAAKKAAAVEAPKKGANMSEEEAKALFDKAQQRNKQAAAPAVQTSRGGRFAAFGDDSD